VKQSYAAYQAMNTSVLEAIKKNFPEKKKQQEFAFQGQGDATKKEGAILTKRITIYFDTGKWELDRNAQYAMKEVAELSSTFGSAYIRVAGNTDNVGSRQSNVELSKKRAQSVADYLVKTYKFDSNKFAVVGNGPDKPVANNDTPEGREQNRRTDIEVVPQQ
jgi:NitT/TauT family transport system substrate-binding protein